MNQAVKFSYSQTTEHNGTSNYMERKAHESIWQECLEIFRDNVNPQSFKTWFEPIKPVRLSNKVLTIQVPSQFFYEWLEEHYVQILHKTLKKVIGPSAKLEYSIIVENNHPIVNLYNQPTYG